MNQLSFLASKEIKRIKNERRHRLMSEIEEKQSSLHPRSGFPVSVEVFTYIPKLIPPEYDVQSYASFPIPENKSRVFLLKDIQSFERFRNYLRNLQASFQAKVEAPPRYPHNVLRGF